MKSRPNYIVALNRRDLLLPLHYLGNELLNLPAFILKDDDLNK